MWLTISSSRGQGCTHSWYISGKWGVFMYSQVQIVAINIPTLPNNFMHCFPKYVDLVHRTVLSLNQLFHHYKKSVIHTIQTWLLIQLRFVFMQTMLYSRLPLNVYALLNIFTISVIVSSHPPCSYWKITEHLNVFHTLFVQ